MIVFPGLHIKLTANFKSPTIVEMSKYEYNHELFIPTNTVLKITKVDLRSNNGHPNIVSYSMIKPKFETDYRTGSINVAFFNYLEYVPEYNLTFSYFKRLNFTAEINDKVIFLYKKTDKKIPNCSILLSEESVKEFRRVYGKHASTV